MMQGQCTKCTQPCTAHATSFLCNLHSASYKNVITKLFDLAQREISELLKIQDMCGFCQAQPQLKLN